VERSSGLALGDALLDTHNAFDSALFESSLDSTEQLHGGRSPTIDGAPEDYEEDVR
jgi:hypothetical protein